jgi:hypothetical protein
MLVFDFAVQHVAVEMSLFRMSHITPPADLKGSKTQLSQNVFHSDTVEKLFLSSLKLLPKFKLFLAWGGLIRLSDDMSGTLDIVRRI